MDLKDVPEFYEVDLGESLISRTETLGEQYYLVCSCAARPG